MAKFGYAISTRSSRWRSRINDPALFRNSLLTFFKFQGTGGDIVDGYIPKDRARVKYKYRSSPLAPDLLAHKNTVETDQEASLVQAIRKYVTVTGDRAILDETISGRSVRKRLPEALDYVLKERFDQAHGLVWGATTADWGDIQPENKWGVELNDSSHRAIDIYDNAMFVIATEDYIQLIGETDPEAARWKSIRDELKNKVRKHLWDTKRRKFFPHLYLEGSPFPKDFDESAVYYHGGTAVAIEAGLLTPEETVHALEQMRSNVRQAGASSPSRLRCCKPGRNGTKRWINPEKTTIISLLPVIKRIATHGTGHTPMAISNCWKSSSPMFVFVGILTLVFFQSL